jgi:hypothetical protein
MPLVSQAPAPVPTHLRKTAPSEGHTYWIRGNGARGWRRGCSEALFEVDSRAAGSFGKRNSVHVGAYFPGRCTAD